MPGQVTGGTQRHSLTVAVFRPWRDLKGSAAPGLPGRQKDTRTISPCQITVAGFYTLIFRQSDCIVFIIQMDLLQLREAEYRSMQTVVLCRNPDRLYGISFHSDRSGWTAMAEAILQIDADLIT